jgi:hypothetical protein
MIKNKKKINEREKCVIMIDEKLNEKILESEKAYVKLMW